MTTFDDPNREAVGEVPIWTGAGDTPEEPPPEEPPAEEPEPEPPSSKATTSS